MYPETADIETSSEDYAKRFAGPAGAWMLKVQEDTVAGWLKDRAGASILDVGGGHGQLAIPLANLGHRVTVLGSDDSCKQRIQEQVEKKHITFTVGNVIAVPFADRSFDVAISIRLIPHCAQWQKLIEELCRIARDSVIVDYPTSRSLNVFSSSMFGLKKKLEGNTRRFTLFRHSEILDEFARHGFELRARRAEFFLPMVFHRMLNMPWISVLKEGFCRATGLTGLFGSPVLVKMQRKK